MLHSSAATKNELRHEGDEEHEEEEIGKRSEERELRLATGPTHSRQYPAYLI